MRFRSERGFTLIEVLIGGAVPAVIAGGIAAMGSAAWSASQTAKVNACVNQFNMVTAARAPWAATVNASTPFGNADLCQQVLSLATKYNEQCAERTGEIPLPECS